MGNVLAPVLFISYSHDDVEHYKRVLGLAQRLRFDGYETCKELQQSRQMQMTLVSGNVGRLDGTQFAGAV